MRPFSNRSFNHSSPCTSSQASTRAPIVFCGKTALEIARAIPLRHTPTPRQPLQLPGQSIAATLVKAAVEELRAMHPSLSLSPPYHHFVGRRAKGPTRMTSPSVATLPLPAHSLHHLGDDVYCATPAFALVTVAARTSDRAFLLELSWELCGTYRTQRTTPDTSYQTPALASVDEIRSFVARNPSVRGSRKIARLLRYVADGSASPRETKCALLFGLPRKNGGYGLGMPRMNHEVIASPEARAISGRSSFRCDLCWPAAKLDVEYQSREMHGNELSRLRDSRRANALASMGWTVVAITNDELESMSATDVIASILRKQLGKRKDERLPHAHERKLALRRALGLPIERHRGY